jgi:DNA-binding transcriptional ArsR family regulator
VPPADFEPEDVRYIRDVETLRAISDPTRMRILEVMVQRQSPAWSVKELAAALEMPQTRLYHHVELLLAQDLIRAVERRVVSGIIETRYNVAARSFQLDRALFAGDSEEGFQVLRETLAAVFDTARAEVELAIRLGVINPGAETPAERGLMLTRGLARLTPARARELRERLQALSEEFGDDRAAPGAGDGTPADDDAQAYGIVLAVYPMPPTQEPTDD